MHKKYVYLKRLSNSIKKFIEENISEIESNNWKKVYDNIYAIKDLKIRNDVRNELAIIFSPFRDSIISQLDYIPQRCFSNNIFLKNYVIPEHIKSLICYSFANCPNLSTLCFGKNLNLIGIAAFDSTNHITDILYDGDITDWCKITFRGSDSNPIGDRTKLYFKNCTNSHNVYSLVDKLIINNKITIPHFAFNNYNFITELVTTQTLKAIQHCAFQGCTNLSKIDISCNYIGDNSFRCCNNLKDITLLDGTEVIGEEAFAWCVNLEVIKLPTTLQFIRNGAFNNCESIKEIIYNGTESKFRDICSQSVLDKLKSENIIIKYKY